MNGNNLLLDLVERQRDAVRHRHHISQRETPDPYDEDEGLSKEKSLSAMYDQTVDAPASITDANGVSRETVLRIDSGVSRETVVRIDTDFGCDASGIDNIYLTAPCSRKGCDYLVRASNVLV